MHAPMHAPMQIVRPALASADEMTEFHAPDYVQFLRHVTPNNQAEFAAQLRQFAMSQRDATDCPIFDRMFHYCQVRTDQRMPASGAHAARMGTSAGALAPLS